MLKTTAFTLIFVITAAFAGGKMCEDPGYREQLVEMVRMSSALDESRLPPEYSCPRLGDPSTYTECCLTGGCCPKLYQHKPDPLYVMVTGIVVITSCLLLAASIIICCFWQHCPLYNTCRANYNTNDIVMYTLAKEEDPSALMPLENGAGSRFKPGSVKIKPMEDV